MKFLGKEIALFKPVYVVRNARGYYVRDSRFVTMKESWNVTKSWFQARRCPSVNRAKKVARLFGFLLDEEYYEIRRLRLFGLFTTRVMVMREDH